MNPILELLEKYKRYTAPDSAVRTALVESIKDVVGIDIHERSIKIIGSAAYIDTDTMIKSAIFIRQDAVLKKVALRLGKVALSALR